MWRGCRTGRIFRYLKTGIELRASDLESLLPEGHRARIVWAYVEQADLSRMRVRGVKKVKCVLLLHALAHNLMRAFALVPELLALGVTAPGVVNVAA